MSLHFITQKHVLTNTTFHKFQQLIIIVIIVIIIIKIIIAINRIETNYFNVKNKMFKHI